MASRTAKPGAVREWTPSLVRGIIARIRDGERGAVAAGIALIEQDQGLPFGKLLKSDTARALRRFATFDDVQTRRLRARFTDMLLRGYLPREYKEYAKLFRKIGLGDFRSGIEARADLSNPFVRRWCWYLLIDHEGPRPRRYLRPW